MKTLFRKAIGTGALFLIGVVTYGQFTLSGEVRPRFEYRHGFSTLADSAADNGAFVDQRTRINLDYKTDGFQTRIVVQDVRVWGSQSQLVNSYSGTNPDGALTTIHEAWGEAFLNDKISFKFGRQELVYDDHRIMGNVGWAQQARSHDAILFKFAPSEGLSIHIGGAYNQNKAQNTTTYYTVPKSYKAMQFFWLHKDINENLGVSILGLSNGQQTAQFTNEDGKVKTNDNYTFTTGTRLTYKKDAISIGFNGYYQMGSTANLPAKSVSAYLVGLDFDYKINDNFSASLGFEMLSGHDQTKLQSADSTYNNDEFHSFNPYFGTNHKFNGFMDYFYVGNHGGNVGLMDIVVRLKYTKEKSSIGLDVHMFRTAANLNDPVAYAQAIVDDIAGGGTGDVAGVAMDASLGTEIDLSYGFALSEGVMLKGGYSHLIATNTMANLKGVGNYDNDGNLVVNDETNNWAYIMIIIKPTFFQQ